MDEAVKQRMEQKFDICYVLAKESTSFHKAIVHELEERHGVDLGFAYNTDVSAKVCSPTI